MIRITLAAFCGLSVATGLIALAIYLTLTGAPSFYQAAVDIDPAVMEEANDQCLQQAAALASDLQSPGEWQAIFSAEQINGWLAVDLARNYGEALPPEITDPRIDFHSGSATLACTYRHAGHETVMSIGFDLYLSEPNVIALRLRRVRAGLLPVPLADILRTIEQAGHGFGLMVQWRQVSGDPVALVHLTQRIDDDVQLQLEAIELREGEIYVAGRTMAPLPETLARRERHAPLEPDRPDEEAAHQMSAEENGDAAEPDAESRPTESSDDDRAATDMPADDSAPDDATTTVGDEAPQTDVPQVGSAVKKNRQR